MPKAGGGEGEGGEEVKSAPPDFVAFFECLAMASMLIRVQVIYNLATDELFAMRTFRAYSASARLRAIAAVAVADWLEVS